MSVEGSACARKSNVFPVTAPLRPIRPAEQDRQMPPRPANSRSGSDVGLVSEVGQGDYRSSTGQVSVALPVGNRRPIGLFLGSLLGKDISTCISIHKADVPFLPSFSVSEKTFKSGFTLTYMNDIADDKHNRFPCTSLKGDHSHAQINDNNASVRPSRLGAVTTDDRDETIRHIEFCDRQLDALDRQARSLSVKTNWTYWHLGKAYKAFCMVSDNIDHSGKRELAVLLESISSSYYRSPHYLLT
jgi:hypothetical protein